jgi:cysteine desulfurase
MIYLDYAATTPITPEARDALIWAIDNCRGNPSGKHAAGDLSRGVMERARRRIGTSLSCSPSAVIFCSSATESLNLAIRGVVDGSHEDLPHLVVSATEHKAVRQTVKLLVDLKRAAATFVPPGAAGAVDPGAIANAIRPNTVLVVVMAVNNETGVINDVAGVRSAIGGAMPILCDATQAIGRLTSETFLLSADAVVLSSHKVGGPVGAAALIASKEFRRRIVPQLSGGGQENAYRAGTEPVALIHAMSVAIEAAISRQTTNNLALRRTQERFERGLLELIPGGAIVGSSAVRSPHVTNILLPNIEGESVVSQLRAEVALSSGSACNGFSAEASQVLTAMGYSRELASCSIRASFDGLTTTAEVDTAVQRLGEVVRLCVN